MGISPYLATLRAAVGPQLLVIPSVTGVVFDAQGRVLLVHQTDVDLWSTPGGAIEPHERPADAVVREVWEETGLYTRPVRLLGVFGGQECQVIYPNGDQVTYVTSVFECQVVSGALRQQSDETTACCFIGPAEIPDHMLTAWARFIVPKLSGGRIDEQFLAPSWVPPSTDGDATTS